MKASLKPKLAGPDSASLQLRPDDLSMVSTAGELTGACGVDVPELATDQIVS